MEIWRVLFRDEAFRRRVGKIIAHPATLLAIATVAAVWLTQHYQTQAWIRDKKFEVFRQNYSNSLALVDELSDLMSRRLFGLNRVIWVAKGTGTGELDEVWDEYYTSVEEWNTKLLGYKGRLERSIGPEAVAVFNRWDDVALGTVEASPTTIHGDFFTAHRKVRELVDCVRDQCSGDQRNLLVTQAEEAVHELSLQVDAFIQNCSVAIRQGVRSD